MEKITCQHCGKTANCRKGARFCSPSCRSMAFKRVNKTRFVPLGDIKYLAKLVQHYHQPEGNTIAEKYLSDVEIKVIREQYQQQRITTD